MKEYRLTFATENFGAISQILVDMGVSFRVEPVEPAAKPVAAGRGEEPAVKPRSPGKKPAKAAAKKKKPDRGSRDTQTRMASAQRVLEGLTRGGTDSTGTVGASPARTAEGTPAADTESSRTDDADS